MPPKVCIDGSLFDRELAEIVRTRTEIVEMALPPSTKVVGLHAFEEERKLKTVLLPDRLEEIADFAFASSGVTHVELPKYVRRIGSFAFAWCSRLQGAALDRTERLEELDECAFGYSGITRAFLPKSTQKDLQRTFVGCEQLRLAVIEPGDMGNIHPDIFAGCKRFRTLYVPARLSKTWTKHFGEDVKIISLPEAETRVGPEPLWGLRRVRVLKLPNCLKTVGAHWFVASCVEEVWIPESVREIGDAAFAHCEHL